jgi:hypothetical protein
VGYITRLVLDVDEAARPAAKEAGYQRAEQLLHKHRAKVERLAAELIASRKGRAAPTRSVARRRTSVATAVLAPRISDSPSATTRMEARANILH